MSDAIRLNQDLLMVLGYYPPRMHRDGVPGNAYRVAVIAFKRWLLDNGIATAEEIHWHDDATNATNAHLDTTTMRLLRDAATTGVVRGTPCPRVPHGDDVAGWEVMDEAITNYLDAAVGDDVPVPWLLAMIEHETRGAWTVDWGRFKHTIIYGCDYSGTDVRYPADLESVDRDRPIVSRGWGPGQVTPSQRILVEEYGTVNSAHVGHIMPPIDEHGRTAPGQWPIWTRDLLANVFVSSKLFAAKFHYKSSIRHECSHHTRHDCASCIAERWQGDYKGEKTQALICSWLEAVLRYAGSGPGALEFLYECREILLQLFGDSK